MVRKSAGKGSHFAQNQRQFTVGDWKSSKSLFGCTRDPQLWGFLDTKSPRIGFANPRIQGGWGDKFDANLKLPCIVGPTKPFQEVVSHVTTIRSDQDQTVLLTADMQKISQPVERTRITSRTSDSNPCGLRSWEHGEIPVHMIVWCGIPNRACGNVGPTDPCDGLLGYILLPACKLYTPLGLATLHAGISF